MNYPVPPELVSLAAYVTRRWPSQPSLGEEAPWYCKLYMPQYRGNARAKKWEWVGRGTGQREGIGEFRDSI